MKSFLGIASMVTVAATGAAMAISRRAPTGADRAGATAPDPEDVTRAIDAARDRLRAGALPQARPGPRAA
jgi:Zn-dependent protease with chaperone function